MTAYSTYLLVCTLWMTEIIIKSYYSPDLFPYQSFSLDLIHFPVKILEDIILNKNKWFNFVKGEENEKKMKKMKMTVGLWGGGNNSCPLCPAPPPEHAPAFND